MQELVPQCVSCAKSQSLQSGKEGDVELSLEG